MVGVESGVIRRGAAVAVAGRNHRRAVVEVRRRLRFVSKVIIEYLCYNEDEGPNDDALEAIGHEAEHDRGTNNESGELLALALVQRRVGRFCGVGDGAGTAAATVVHDNGSASRGGIAAFATNRPLAVAAVATAGGRGRSGSRPARSWERRRSRPMLLTRCQRRWA